jgi:hypothetical protein
MYPEDDKDILVVAFSNSASTAPKELFGADFNKERVVGDGMMPVTQQLAFCGMKPRLTQPTSFSPTHHINPD